MDTIVASDLDYQSGFGNEVATEALPGALPAGRNSPQKAPYGLYTEHLSGTAFTVPRVGNQRAWLYRIRPSAQHQPFERIDNRLVRSTPFGEAETPPNRMRWDPLPIPDAPTDFVDGLVTYMGNGDSTGQTGIAIHLYAANRSMEDRYFFNSDGEMLFVPQQGRLRLHTEMGVLDVAPNQIAVIQRGIKFRVELPDGPSRGYVGENYGATFRLPDLGPIGANGLANPRDFLTPVAAYEDRDEPCELVTQVRGQHVDRRNEPRAARRGRLARHLRPLQVRFVQLQHHLDGQLRPSGIPPSIRCSPRPPTRRARRTWTSSSSRPAGWSPRIRSARRGTTAM